MGFEPTTFCMASRRSSQLSYSRASGEYSQGRSGTFAANGTRVPGPGRPAAWRSGTVSGPPQRLECQPPRSRPPS